MLGEGGKPIIRCGTVTCRACPLNDAGWLNHILGFKSRNLCKLKSVICKVIYP